MGLAHTSKVPAVVRDLRLGHLRVFNGVIGRVCLEAPILRPDRGPSSQHDPPDYAAGQAAPSRGECTVGFHIPSAPRGRRKFHFRMQLRYARHRLREPKYGSQSLDSAGDRPNHLDGLRSNGRCRSATGSEDERRPVEKANVAAAISAVPWGRRLRETRDQKSALCFDRCG